MDRRNELLTERRRQKVRADLADVMDRDTKARVDQLEAETGLKVVDNVVDQALQTGRLDASLTLQDVRAALAAHERQNRFSSRPLCEFCQRQLGICSCDNKNFRSVFSPQMLQDEYSMLAYMQSQQAREQEELEKRSRRLQARQYASQLGNQLALQQQQEEQWRREQEAYDLQIQRQAQAWKAEQQRLKQKEFERKRQCFDELDRFCEEQKIHSEHEKLRERKEEEEILAAAQWKQKQEAEKQFAMQQAAREQARNNRLTLQQQQARKLAEEKAQMEQDKQYMRLAEEQAKRREEEKQRERQAFLARQERILQTVGQSISKVEEERRKQLEDAFTRWEAEQKRKDDAKLAMDALNRQQSLEKLQYVRKLQVMDHQLQRQEEQREQQQYAQQLQRELQHSIAKEEQRRQEMQQQKSIYRNELLGQVEHEKATRNERLMIGMNDVERRMNRPILSELHDFVLCANGLHPADHCTCGHQQGFASTFHGMPEPPQVRGHFANRFEHPQRALHGHSAHIR